MWRSFKEFISRGNVVDLAVAFVLGIAFGQVVTSFVKDIILPPIGMILGRVDFSNLFINLSGAPYASLAEAQAAGAPTINYGLFINSIVNFLIVAFALFLFVRAFQRMKRKEQGIAPAEPTIKPCPFCLTEIPRKASRCPNCTSELVPVETR
ncbi:MAG: large conductance mechanosensitive channel protein MscL [Candidatus Latescibacterota bacterium]